MLKKIHALILLTTIVFVSCNFEKNRIKPSLAGITVEDMKNHISVLASDDFIGRAPSNE
jgi:hypothetical protein